MLLKLIRNLYKGLTTSPNTKPHFDMSFGLTMSQIIVQKENYFINRVNSYTFFYSPCLLLLFITHYYLGTHTKQIGTDKKYRQLTLVSSCRLRVLWQ